MSSWADDADDDNSAPDFSAIPPPPKAGWGKVEAVQPVGLVFEDFEGPVPSGNQESRAGNSDRGGYGGRGGDDRGGYGGRGGDNREGYGYGGRGGDDRGGYGGRGGDDRGGYGGRGGDDREESGGRGGYGGRGGDNREEYGGRGGYGGDRRGGYGDRDGRYGDRGYGGGRGRYDDDAGPGNWRDMERPELPPREERPRVDRPPREDRPRREERPHPTQHEPPTEEMLSKIPMRKPFTAFVAVDPRVAFDVTLDDIGYHFQDDEHGTILVERVRVVNFPDSNKVKMIFVDFENQESLKNALYLDKPFRDKALRVEVAESRGGAREERPPRSWEDRPRRDDRDRGGIRGKQYDVDTAEAEWMAQRVQEKVVIDDAPGTSNSSAKPAAAAGKTLNPFGDAKPRDASEYEARKAAERAAARAEADRKRELDREKKKGGAEKPETPGGNWRDNAAPVAPRGGARGGGGADRSERGGRGGGAAGRGPRAEGDAERAPARDRAVAAEKKEDAPKAPKAVAKEPAKKPAKVNMFDLLGEEDD